MSDLWSVVAELSGALDPERIKSAATAIGRLKSRGEVKAARSRFGPNLSSELWKSFLTAWDATPDVSPQSVAVGLRVGCRAAERAADAEDTSLAWTGPSTGFVPVRSTEQVMLEVIQNAQVAVFLVSYVNVGAASIVAALNDAAACNVRVQLLLEESTGAASKMSRAVPAAQVFVWPEDSKLRAGHPSTASVHAKCVVADDREAFITSANLTDFALEKNMELGVHIVGGRQPSLLANHLRALISTRQVEAFG